MAYIDKNTKKGSVRDFLQVCTEVNYHVDYVHNDLFVKDKISQKDAVKNMTSFVNQFIKLEKSIDMKALTEEEKMIVETAAEKVDDQLNLMNSVIDDSFVII